MQIINKEIIDAFYRDVENLGLKFPVAGIAKRTGFSKGNVSQYLSKNSTPSKGFLEEFYKCFEIVPPWEKPATLYEVRAIINKLMKDGYAEEIKAMLPQPALFDLGYPEAGYILSYKITFEGMYLKSSGGYQGLQNEKNAESIRLEKIERKARANQIFLTWLTVIVAVSSAATVVYYAVELYWKYGWFR